MVRAALLFLFMAYLYILHADAYCEEINDCDIIL